MSLSFRKPFTAILLSLSLASASFPAAGPATPSSLEKTSRLLFSSEAINLRPGAYPFRPFGKSFAVWVDRLILPALSVGLASAQQRQSAGDNLRVPEIFSMAVMATVFLLGRHAAHEAYARFFGRLQRHPHVFSFIRSWLPRGDWLLLHELGIGIDLVIEGRVYPVATHQSLTFYEVKERLERLYALELPSNVIFEIDGRSEHYYLSKQQVSPGDLIEVTLPEGYGVDRILRRYFPAPQEPGRPANQLLRRGA